MGDFDFRIDKVSANPQAAQSTAAQAARQRQAAAKAEIAQGQASERSQAVEQSVRQVKELVRPGESEEKTLERVAKYLESFIPDLAPNTRLKIDKDEEAGRFVYQSVDNKSGEVVKQFPPEDLLSFLKQFREASGILFDREA